MERVLRGKEPLMGTPREPPRRCPRCESTNTKFCYFNNYSQSQPRHFCRACRRYWTEGGTLRNVPQGGGSNRRAKRPRAQVPVRPRESIAPLVDPPPMLPNLLIGGGGGGGSGGGEVGMPGSTLDFPAFHPGRISGTTMVADFAGFQACYDQACFNPTAPMPPAGFLNMPNYPQMLPPTPPPFDSNLIIASRQQMNITVFTTTTTTMTAATAAAAAAVAVSSATAGANIGIGGDLGFWNNSDLNIHGDEGSSPPATNPSDTN